MGGLTAIAPIGIEIGTPPTVGPPNAAAVGVPVGPAMPSLTRSGQVGLKFGATVGANYAGRISVMGSLRSLFSREEKASQRPKMTTNHLTAKVNLMASRVIRNQMTNHRFLAKIAKGKNGVAILIAYTYVSSVIPILLVLTGNYYYYVLGLAIYGLALLILYYIHLIIPGLFLAISFLHGKNSRLVDYAVSVQRLAFLVGFPLIFSAAVQFGVSSDMTRGADPEIYSIRLSSIAIILIVEVIFTVYWVCISRRSA